MPPAWLWDAALASLAIGGGLSAYGVERRDRARGGSYRDRVPRRFESGPDTITETVTQEPKP
jgi:hypothetical protein